MLFSYSLLVTPLILFKNTVAVKPLLKTDAAAEGNECTRGILMCDNLRGIPVSPGPIVLLGYSILTHRHIFDRHEAVTGNSYVDGFTCFVILNLINEYLRRVYGIGMNDGEITHATLKLSVIGGFLPDLILGNREIKCGACCHLLCAFGISILAHELVACRCSCRRRSTRTSDDLNVRIRWVYSTAVLGTYHLIVDPYSGLCVEHVYYVLYGICRIVLVYDTRVNGGEYVVFDYRRIIHCNSR